MLGPAVLAQARGVGTANVGYPRATTPDHVVAALRSRPRDPLRSGGGKSMSEMRSAGDAPEIRPLAGALGAQVLGVDLSRDLDDGTSAIIRRAFVEHLVLYFPAGRPLDAGRLMALMRHFGELDDQPFAGSFRLPNVDGSPFVFGFVKEASDRKINLGGFWHADVTCRRHPHRAALLYCKQAPRTGGDTLFANQYLALEALSPGMRSMLSGLNAVHSSSMDYGRESARFAAVGRNHVPRPEDARFSTDTYDANANPGIEESVHPVVRIHPDTGRRYLFLNRAFTVRFEGMTQAESEPLLEFLWAHAARPEFTCAVRWQTDAVALWDNRCTQHYAVNDYFGERREMHRVAVHDA
jgi:taurine dioxygenase